MDPTRKHIDPISVVGISVRTINQDELNANTAKIPMLWERFLKEINDAIPNQVSNFQTYAVYSSYESDCNGKYTVTAGKNVSETDNLPRGLEVVNIEGGNYLVFEGRGHIPEVVINLWKEVWNYFSSTKELKRKYTTDFELYKENGEVSVHIAVA